MEQTAFVDLKFRPSLELVPIVRRFVSNFYRMLLHDDELASRMALATHELLENSVKFSSDGDSAMHIGVEKSLTGEDIVVVRTHNRTGEHNRTQAVRIVNEMKAAGDAFDYYQQLMRLAAKRKDGSGLGLARICAEAEMTLDCEVVDDAIAMLARAPVPKVRR